jgi:energy-coupling factor transporter ATP-binding protein EcfA2
VMATHDHAIVDQTRKRVVEFERGKVVRDEQQGGYVEQTTTGEQELWNGYGTNYGGQARGF